ncbi:member of Set1p complex, histone methyl transferase [Ceratobasidium sp. 423]|nr:member of Set1p complex, histone methyl transferase [Ceratobasidium sp. 423]
MANPPTSGQASGAPSQIILDENIMQRLKPARIFKSAVDSDTSGPPGRHNLPNHITGLTFDDLGDFLLTASEDETFRLYNAKTGKHVKTLASKKYGVDLPRFTHKNTTIIYASTKEDDTIRYHSLHDNKYLQYFRGHKKRVVSLDVSPVDDGFMSSSLDNTVRLWDLRSPQCRGLLNLPAPPVVAYDSTGVVFGVAINQYSRILLYDMSNFDKEPFKTIHLDDTRLAKISYPPRIPVMTSMSFSNNGKWLLVGTAGEVHYVLDAFDGDLLCRLEGHLGLERGKTGNSLGVVPDRGISGEEVCWTPDSKFIVSGSQTGKIHVWDIAKFLERQPPITPQSEVPTLNASVTLDGHPGASRCVKFNPRNCMMATAGAELAFWLPETPSDGVAKPSGN